MKVRCVWEHNGDDSLLYAVDYIGAFTRGENLNVAQHKLKVEIQSYLSWLGDTLQDDIEMFVVQERESDLEIKDADSDVLFASEEESLSMEEYFELKKLALKSAADFLSLYEIIPDKAASVLPVRKTFYGQTPRTAEEMYQHTKNVNSYYFGEIGVDADNEDNILECRKRGFEALEKTPDFLSGLIQEGSFGEMWSVRKVVRRFVWHDRIHAKAMWRMTRKTFADDRIKNIFRFQ